MAGTVELGRLLGRAVRQGFSRGLSWREVLRQTSEIGTRSLPLVLGGMMFFGAAIMSHGAYQARKVVGDLSVVGPAFFELMIRELGPTIAGVLAAVRIGAAISAELASMQVTEQIDALKMSAGDPYSDLVLPRICGGVIGVVCLIVAGTAAAVLVAALSATYLYNADGRAFLDASLIDRGDLTAFFVKAFGYGLGIPLAASASGLAARGGSGAVGAATTSGVVTACVSVLAIDLAVSGVLFWAGL